jgi:hypothetical protein
VSLLPDAALTPRALCRRILSAVRQRLHSDYELSYLEMLLTYFIDRNPSPASFADQLDQYVADARPGIAEAAATVRAAWQRSQQQVQEPTLPLPEMLRLLGAALDTQQAAMATLHVQPGAVTLRIFGLLQEEHFDAQALQHEHAARQALRGHVPATSPPAAARYEPLLRALGTILEAEPPQTYTLVVTSQVVGVEGARGYFRLFSVADLLAQAQARQRQRGARQQDDH